MGLHADFAARHNGFSLVELLVVIALVVGVISILVPTVNGVRRSANATACANNLRTFGLGFINYAGQFDGVLPWDGWAEGDREERHLGRWDDPMTWFNCGPTYSGHLGYDAQQKAALAGGPPLPRMGQTGMFVCPEAGEPVSGPQDDLIIDGYLMLWGLDENNIAVRRPTYWCYAYNTQLDGGLEDRHVNYRVCFRAYQFKQPSETVLLLEKLMRPKEFTPPFQTGIGQQQAAWKEFTTRHKGGGFLLFVDGHVGYFKRKEVLKVSQQFNYNQPTRIIWNPFGPAF